MPDTQSFALLVLLAAGVGLVAVLSSHLTTWLKIPSPALFLVVVGHSRAERRTGTGSRTGTEAQRGVKFFKGVQWPKRGERATPQGTEPQPPWSRPVRSRAGNGRSPRA